jgi:hypothetical protein
LKIRSFKGNAEPGEDAEEYLDDVQMAAESWENGKGDTDSLNTALLRFFRQNLEPNYDAAWWWGGLSKEDVTGMPGHGKPKFKGRVRIGEAGSPGATL